MARPSGAQSLRLATTLQSIVSRFHPRSLAILGAAGGSGLELVDAAIVRRIIALDMNADYLRVCASRHAAPFAEFEPVQHACHRGRQPSNQSSASLLASCSNIFAWMCPAADASPCFSLCSSCLCGSLGSFQLHGHS